MTSLPVRLPVGAFTGCPATAMTSGACPCQAIGGWTFVAAGGHIHGLNLEDYH